MAELAERTKFPLCIGCGQENPVGFKLKVYQDGPRARAQFVPGEYHTGWHGVVHGGVLLLLMDEVMSYLPFYRGLRMATGKMEARFRRPVHPGQPLLISAEIVRHKTRTILAQASIRLDDGTLVAEAEGILLPFEKEE